MQCLTVPRRHTVLLLAEPSDEQLLACYINVNDEAALDALIERHKPMVFVVCWRVLNHYQNAENAAQRTFLVLMRNAKSIRNRASLRNWLCGVACRVAKNIRKYRKWIEKRERSQQSAQSAQSVQSVQIADRLEYCELQALVDEGVQRLPEKIRDCFILHCLEGRSKADTAAELGLPEGTVASRTARGRMLMQAWLTQHGITGP